MRSDNSMADDRSRGNAIHRVQVHFDGTQSSSKELPGLDLTLTPAATPFSAGVLSSAASFVVPPGRDSFQVMTLALSRALTPQPATDCPAVDRAFPYCRSVPCRGPKLISPVRRCQLEQPQQLFVG